MIALLAANPVLLLFAVVAIGYPLGRLNYRGVSLGVAAILFAGLGVGALDPRLKLPEFVAIFGLVMFVYSVGLTSGPGFFASLRRDGVRNALLVLGALLAAAVVVVAGGRLFGFGHEPAAGLFAGAVTNTPSLAAVLELLRGDARAAGAAGAAVVDATRLAAPVVAHSVAYPFGVIGPVIAVLLVPFVWRAASASDVQASQEWPVQAPATARQPAGSGGLVVETIRVLRADAAGVSLRELRRALGVQVAPARVRHRDGTESLATRDVTLAPGDLISVVGTADDVERLAAHLGERAPDPINTDRRRFDARRIFVSDARVAGRRLDDLDLEGQYEAIVTAVRRGDADWVPRPSTVLQLGDRLRVLAPRARLAEVSRFLGDSYRAVSEMDVLTYSFGVTLGVAVGLVPIPLPGGLSVKLGMAGGPLLVAMVLGARGRTGPLVWGLPYGVNLTLRQLGLLLFFAGIGTQSGYATWVALRDPATLALLGVGAATTLAAAGFALVVGRYVFRVPAGVLEGMIAGICTQPGALSLALDRRRDEAPNVGYAAAFPFATVLKVVIAQVIARL